jgi:GNAT superfamily N-acetyltransferase
MMSGMDMTFRFLGPDEGTVLTRAIEAAYGQTYDVRWVYDPDEVGARIGAGTYIACIAETPAGGLLCHIGMSLAAAGDAVAHSGQAVTLPAARGQHLFTRTKRHLMDWARERGLAGMYSEATAAHPYSQKANIELGAHETGFLLGWIPATVANDAAGGHRGRQSAALFYTKLNDGREREVFAPERHREIVEKTIELCELRGTVADPPASCRWRTRRRPWWPTVWSGSASPTPASSPTARPTGTCSACSRCTESESRPTTLPSPRTTGRNYWSTSSPIFPTARRQPLSTPSGRRPCA